LKSSPSNASLLPRNVRLYWRAASLPADNLLTLARKLQTAKEAGGLGMISALLSAVSSLAEIVLLPRQLSAYLQEAGWCEMSSSLTSLLDGLARKAPDWRELGTENSGGAHVGLAPSAGIVIFNPGVCQAEAWIHTETACRHARTCWTTPLLDAEVVAPGGLYGDRFAVKARVGTPAPVPTSNPDPRHVARMVRATPTMGRLRSVLLIGPSGAGKTMTALATARELGAGGRTLRMQGPTLKNVEAQALEQLLALLAPTCLLLDDIDTEDTAHLMHLLDHLAGAGRQILVLATVMHEGPLEDARLPGLRPERMDVIVPFSAPTEADRRALLAHYGLGPDMADQLATDARLEKFTGAYLRALADRVLAGVPVEESIESLLLHHQMAGHNQAPSRSGNKMTALRTF